MKNRASSRVQVNGICKDENRSVRRLMELRVYSLTMKSIAERSRTAELNHGMNGSSVEGRDMREQSGKCIVVPKSHRKSGWTIETSSAGPKTRHAPDFKLLLSLLHLFCADMIHSSVQHLSLRIAQPDILSCLQAASMVPRSDL